MTIIGVMTGFLSNPISTESHPYWRYGCSFASRSLRLFWITSYLSM